MTTREQIITAAQHCWPSDRRMWSVDAELPRIKRFYAIAFEAGRVAGLEACAALCYEQNWLVHGADLSERILSTKVEAK